MAPTSHTEPPVMTGGVRDILVDFSKKQSSPAELLFVFLLILGIIFPSSISKNIVKNLSTVPGRAIVFGVLIAILHYTNWVYGLLFALFIGILLSTHSIQEGFMSDFSFDIITDENKWFVERLFKETPVAIREERVKTVAVQDNEARSMSKSSM